MELRNYLQVVRRQRWIIAYAVVMGMLIGALISLLSTPVYQATTSLLLQPNNPAERVTADPGGAVDPDRYAADQVVLITGQQVIQRAAATLGVPRDDLEGQITAGIGDSSGVVVITALNTVPSQASAAANAVAEAYIADRKATDVAGLQRAAQGIAKELTALTAQIATLRRDPLVQGGDAALQAANIQYTTLFSRQQDLLIDSSLKEGGAKIVSAAILPTVPQGVSLPVSTLLGGFLALMLGLAVAFLRDHLDDRVRGRSEVEELIGHPALADLPVDRLMARQPHRLAMRDDPLGPFAEATRALRTSIGFLGVEEPIRRVMVSSAVSGEGKTVVAVNLAAAFAQAGSRTLLVSADLRRPRLEGMLQLGRPAQGLSTVLAGGALDPGRHTSEDDDPAALWVSLRSAMVQTDMPNLMVLPAGIAPPNPAELLGSPRMDQVLRELDEAFDVVVLDATPLVPVTDAAALASKVGHVLLVTSAGTSRRRSVERMMEITRLTDARVLGVVLNRAEVQGGLAAGYYETDQAPRKSSASRGRGKPAVRATASPPPATPPTSTAPAAPVVPVVPEPPMMPAAPEPPTTEHETEALEQPSASWRSV